jgi:IS30 family transposase
MPTTPLFDLDEVIFLLEMGMSPDVIVEKLDVKPGTIARRMYRHQIPEAHKFEALAAKTRRRKKK